MGSFMLALLLCSGSVWAQETTVYQWTDENGVVHFSDAKPAGQAVEEQTLTAPPANTGAAQLPDSAPDSIAQQRRDEIARKRQEAKASQAANQARCAEWQAEVDRLEPNRRVFFTNENGETERMDDVERTDRVAELKEQIARHCG
jgi:cell division septation protein DedD